MRGGDSYELGDLAVGTATAAREYASDNRERLASVGGSAMGMVAGAALLGPVGILAGGLLGGSAGKSTMKALAEDRQKDKEALEQSASSQENDVPPDFVFGKSTSQSNVTPAMNEDRNKEHSHQQGYHFGDIIRGIVRRGKRSDVRDESSGYKFVS